MSLVAEPPKEVLFWAKRDSLRLTMVARYPERDPVSGQMTGQSKGRFVAFRDFKCYVPQSGKVKLVDSLNGGEAEMDAAEVVDWLKSHRLFGDRQEGFWLHEEPAPVVSAEEQQRVSDAATEHDVETLEAMLKAEQAGWAREEFLGTIRHAVDKIAEVQRKYAVDPPAVEPEKPRGGRKPQG